MHAIVKDPFVDQGEQCVEDCAVGLEDLVDEGNLGLGEITQRLSLISIIFKGPHGQWPKELLTWEVGGS